MKKSLILILLASFLSLNTVVGQGVQAGIKASLNSTWLFNNHISDASSKWQTYVPSFGQSYGLSGAIFFNKRLGVEMNFFYDTHRQKYSNDYEDFESETKLNRISIPLMLKLKSETGAYFELGVVYNALTSAEFSFSVDSFAFPEADIKDKMAKTSLDGMFGIGVDIDLAAGFALTAALRFSYSLTDLKGVDAYGGDLSDPLVLFVGYANGDYEETHSAHAGFLFGLTYSIGRIAGD